MLLDTATCTWWAYPVTSVGARVSQRAPNIRLRRHSEHVIARLRHQRV